MTMQKMKIAPHLFVGLGGCGSQIVNEIARKLKRRAEEYDRYRNLVAFFAFDTDIGELTNCGSVDHFVPIGNFDKREFVEHAYGQRGAPEDELFTSWWPEYYQPRATGGAGAGQIRIESRLSVYRTLRAMPQHLTTIQNAVRRAYDASERFRDVDKQPMVHIYASLAGGTGSGSFLPLAYLMRDMVAHHQNPIMVGTFVLPGVFRGKGLPAQQLDKIMANGYAALMELELLQGADDTPHGRIRFQYDPNAKQPTYVARGPFDQIYLVDDVGTLASVMSNASDVYPAIADAAYTQIFSDIIERDRSTADNDEREIAVSDDQHYTKQYGSFGLSALVLPDADILAYVAHRFAAEAIERSLAFSDEDAAAERGGEAVSPERREQQFAQQLASQARLPGETGQFFRNAIEWVDGSATGGTGKTAELLRLVDGERERFDRIVAALPTIKEEWLGEFEDNPDEVRSQLRRRLDHWKEAVARASEEIKAEARSLAGEIAGDVQPHSIGRLTAGADMLRVRYLLFKLEAQLRELQSYAGTVERQARGMLDRWEEKFESHIKALVTSAPKTFLEKFTGNDYSTCVNEFLDWYRTSLLRPQAVLLKARADLELFGKVLEELGERRTRTASLFDDLGAIRREIVAAYEDLLNHGVGRDHGGQAQEFTLDVEVYQDHLDPQHRRLWNVLYRKHVDESMFAPEEIARAIQEAERSATGKPQKRKAVIAALVELGREKFRPAITGKHDPQSLGEMGLTIWAGLEDEARISWAWRRLRERFPRGIDTVPAGDWEATHRAVTDQEVEGYIAEVLAQAARQCAPFWRLSEAATKIEPKRYVVVHDEYVRDSALRRRLTDIAGFNVPDTNLLRFGDPKRIVFYWNEMGVPIYRVQSINEYGRRYEFVKKDELRRGRTYHASELRYKTSVPELQQLQARCEGKPYPDVPLHIDRCWEGAPDPERCLFPITMDAVREGRAKLAWEAARARQDEAKARQDEARAEARAFALCRALGLVARVEGEGFVIALSEIKNAEDRALGSFLDEAREAFGRARPEIKGFVLKRMEARLADAVRSRDRATIEQMLRPHLAALEVEVLNARPREAAVIKEEVAELEAELRKLLELA